MQPRILAAKCRAQNICLPSEKIFSFFIIWEFVLFAEAELFGLKRRNLSIAESTKYSVNRKDIFSSFIIQGFVLSGGGGFVSGAAKKSCCQDTSSHPRLILSSHRDEGGFV